MVVSLNQKVALTGPGLANARRHGLLLDLWAGE
jgi:hypothetical protein